LELDGFHVDKKSLRLVELDSVAIRGKRRSV
jgi:hypothetical protein